MARPRFRCKVGEEAVLEWVDDTGQVVGAVWVRSPSQLPPPGKRHRVRDVAGVPPLALLWNEVAPPLLGGKGSVTVIDTLRRGKADARLRDVPDLALWREAFTLLCRDQYLRENGYATFDYAVSGKAARWLDMAKAGQGGRTATDYTTVLCACGRGNGMYSNRPGCRACEEEKGAPG